MRIRSLGLSAAFLVTPFLIPGLSSSIALTETITEVQSWPPTPQLKLPLGLRKTVVGILVKVDRAKHADITLARDPRMFGPTRRQHVIAPRGTILLVLHFEVGRFFRLDRERLLVRDGEGETYKYGGWEIDDLNYKYRKLPGFRLDLGPWVNQLWEPVEIMAWGGRLDLVYPVDPKADKFKFTDGTVVIELGPLIKRKE